MKNPQRGQIALKEQEQIKCLNPQVVRKEQSNKERGRTPKRTPNLEEPSHTGHTREVKVLVWVLVHPGCKTDGCLVDLKCFSM
jgi:hypothetical protein